ncbi:unnamed protein product [Gongylonema pulchrum]|uniref:Transmembrane protein n=1 Tax=Gongylonema pulchrum TaxID=637853 RepID=A0A183E975_9BILA|nr:unnamed protein product [Gongylonema pulchrum]
MFLLSLSEHIIHKLDQIPDDERQKLEDRQKELLCPKVTTVLQRRRTASIAKEKRNIELVSKPKALTGYFSCFEFMTLMCSKIHRFEDEAPIRIDAEISPFSSMERIATQLNDSCQSIKTLFYSLTLNMVLVIALHFTMPNQNYPLLRIIHGIISILAFALSRICGTVWFADIASASAKYTGFQMPNISISRMAGDFVTAGLLDFVFLVQSLVVNYMPVPYISSFLAFIHLALLNALFSFEYLWMSLGIGLNARINRIERNWPYFLGYGTTLTVLTSLTDSMMVNALLFGVFFPFAIISSYTLHLTSVINSSILNAFVFQVHPNNYEQSVWPHVHLFHPSVAVTDHLTTSFSSMLKAFKSSSSPASERRGSALRGPRITLRNHHSYSPMRVGAAETRTKHTRSGHSAE